MLDPQAIQAQYLAALRQLFKALARRAPLILVLDDIHWIDPSSAELIGKLLPLTTDIPIFFCFVTRPDRETPGWHMLSAARQALGDRVTEITLNPLSDADSRLLVSNLLEIEALPEHIRTLILQKAEGNPFFVEEVMSIEIPDNLQGLLLARIDRLPEDVKRTLRVAAVIGRQFSVKVLEQVLEMGR
jgi:predicted ATPase